MSGAEKTKLYLEKGAITKTDKLLNLIAGKLHRHHLAKQIFNSPYPHQPAIAGPAETLHIETYKGTNPVVHQISALFRTKKLPAVHSVILHGSIATHEEIPYSDFDGVIIINEAKIENHSDLFQLRELIVQTELMMFRQDALQHHGWKIFFLQDFLIYPDAEFPLDLLISGKGIYPEQQVPILYRKTAVKGAYQKGLYQISDSIHRKCNLKVKDNFALKILCSEIMLLPALFLQAKEGKTVSKKTSFNRLKDEFKTIDQTILQEVSKWREEWTQAPIDKKLLLFHRLRQSGFYISAFAPVIPLRLKEKLTDEWYENVKRFCNDLTSSISDQAK